MQLSKECLGDTLKTWKKNLIYTIGHENGEESDVVFKLSCYEVFLVVLFRNLDGLFKVYQYESPFLGLLVMLNLYCCILMEYIVAIIREKPGLIGCLLGNI